VLKSGEGDQDWAEVRAGSLAVTRPKIDDLLEAEIVISRLRGV
jgi:hypothetical protein